LADDGATTHAWPGWEDTFDAYGRGGGGDDAGERGLTF
jgi:hypothetical protein